MRRTTTLVLTGALAGAFLATTGCGSRQVRDTENPMVEAQRDRARAIQLIQQADDAYRAGDTNRAIELYRESISMSGDLPSAWNNLGKALMEQKRFADAVSAFSVAADLEPTDPRPLYNIGVCYQRMDWGKEALEYFGRALDREPNHIHSLRGATVASSGLGVATDVTLERIKRGQLHETNDEWREFFQRQRFLVEDRLSNERRPG